MPTQAAPGVVLTNRYRIVDRIARGGMATVWVAEDTLLARKVAVKTLHPELAADATVRDRFRNEAIAAAALAHPGIVTTYDTGEDDGCAYIVMELVEGQNLRHLLDAQGTLPVDEALRIARGVAVALEEAHRRGIVHRDIKPANVLLQKNGGVKVTDFGIAKAAGKGDLTSAGTIVGTARYLAPEQVRGEPTDGRTDLYSLGLLLYEMLAGDLPFHGDTEMGTALARLSTPPDPMPSSVPPSVSAIVARCLAINPDDRWPNAHALAAAIDTVARGGSVPAPAPPRDTTAARAPTAPAAPAPPVQAPRPTAARPVRPKQSAAWPWAILGGILLGAGAGGGYLLIKELDKKNDSTANAAIVIAGADDFDPLGGDGERPDLVGLAVDGDGSTAWKTEHYSTAELGGKEGVGLIVRLESIADVSRVEIDADDSGWSAEIYVAESAADTLAGWGAPVASGSDLPTNASFDFDETPGGAILIWLTHLPSSGQLQIFEVRVG